MCLSRLPKRKSVARPGWIFIRHPLRPIKMDGTGNQRINSFLLSHFRSSAVIDLLHYRWSLLWIGSYLTEKRISFLAPFPFSFSCDLDYHRLIFRERFYLYFMRMLDFLWEALTRSFNWARKYQLLRHDMTGNVTFLSYLKLNVFTFMFVLYLF